MKVIKITFIFIYMVVSLSFILVLFKGQKNVLMTENRAAKKISMPTVSDFFDRSYQDNLEKALSDQFIKGEGLKTALLTCKNKVFTIMPKGKTENAYYQITQNFCGYNNSDYMLYRPFSNNIVDKQINDFKKVATPYNNIKGVDKYFYFINTDQSIDFRDVNYTIYEDLKELYSTFKSDCLKIDSFDTYKNWFYKTDHHWNYKGAEQGYEDIIKLMFGESEKTLKPQDEITFDTLFYGSRSNKDKYYKFKEKFKVYKYDIKEHKTYVNKEETEYGNKSKYFNNTIDYNDNTNHYANFYGGDYAEVVYDFNQPDKDNLLIISGSFSNAINELVASHFNKTYIIDIRHYKDFDVDKYIKENKIDKFIFISYIAHCKSNEFLLGGEE